MAMHLLSHPHTVPPRHVPSGETDARIPLLAVLASIAAIGSEPLGVLAPFLLYLPLTMIFAILAEHSVLAPWKRIFPVLPVLGLLGAGFPLSRWLDVRLGGNPPWLVVPDGAWQAGFSLFLRALCALLLLSTLVHMVGFVPLLRALHSLGLPTAIVLTLQQMERYRAVLAEEWRRSQFARAARSPGALAFSLSGYANQTSLVFLRSWERSERIHAAMLARGFRLEQAPHSVTAVQQPGVQPLLRWGWLPFLAILIRLTV